MLTSPDTPGARFVPSVVLRRRDGRIWLSRDDSDVLKLPVSDATRLAVLEAFVFASGVDEAFERFAGRRVALAARMLDDVDGVLDRSVDAWCPLSAGRLTVALRQRGTVELTEVSRETSGVLEAMFDRAGDGARPEPSASRGAFDRQVGELAAAAALSPRPGCVEFGDFKRLWPFSHRFGFDRGVPLDRYYLKMFLREIHGEVRGRCLEIGGRLSDNRGYRFAVDEFRTLELEARHADDIVGDAANRDLFEPESWDSILAFHVLEHCPDPFSVARNIHAWLKPGGQAFIVVPCAQRVHHFPGDYWRFMPDGLRVVFKDFAEVTVSAYGNPLTLVSSYLGLSHTEFTTEDMEFMHPDYPVLACAVARK